MSDRKEQLEQAGPIRAEGSDGSYGIGWKSATRPEGDVLKPDITPRSELTMHIELGDCVIDEVRHKRLWVRVSCDGTIGECHDDQPVTRFPDDEHAIRWADDGKTVGVDNPDKVQKTVRQIASWCYPAISHTSRVLESDGKHVVAVIVRPDHNRPHFAGPAFVRVGSESVKASESEFDALIAIRVSKLRPLLEAKRKGEMVGVSVWHFGNKSAPEDCTVVECTPQFVLFQPKSGGPISADYEQIRLGKASDGKQLRVEILH